jgi:nucleolar GTP-binding protein
MKNPFNNFYHVPNSQELLDIAFKRAMKSSAQVSQNAPILIKAKKKESKRVKVAVEELIKKIFKIIESVPIIDELPDFYKELASILVDVDKLRLTLGKLNGILPILRKVQGEIIRQLKRIEAPKDGDRLRRAAFGRISSIINKQNRNLEYLNTIRGSLQQIPSIDYTMPCVVIAGYPNVGKSSIVKNISTNKRIEIREYPFTTKQLKMGHLDIEKRFEKIKIQCLDTPGILDRPMSKRNKIELQAVLALRLISDLILFIFDPTPACGYDIKSQIELFNEIKDNFSKDGEVEILIVFNKMDLAKDSEIVYLRDSLNLQDKEFYLTNALSGENLDKLIDDLKERYWGNA